MDYKQQFISNYGPLAQDISQQTGLDPSLVLGQIAHESNWGRTVHDNNILGITPGGKLASYVSVPQAAQAYVDLINRRYQNATTKQGVASQAEALSSGGYGPNNGYGRLIANAAQTVQAAGFKPPSSSSQSSDLVDQGKQLFQQMTGMAPVDREPDPQQPASVDVSSDPMVDQGKEMLKQMTGIDPDESDKSAAEVAKGEPAGTEPAQGTAGTSPAGAASSNQPSNTQAFGAGVGHGMGSVISPMVGYLSKLPGVSHLDQAVPMLGKLDQAYSPNAQAEQQYQAVYGNRFAAQMGNFAGQTAATLPVTAPLGAIGGAAAGAVANPLLRGSILMGTGAAQGAAGAGMTGGNVTQGAVGGAAMGMLGNAVSGVGNSMQNGGVLSNIIQSKVADKLVGLLSAGAGMHLSGGMIEGALMGMGAGEAVKAVAQKYGAAAAGGVAKLLQAGNATGVTTGAAGAVTGAMPNPMAPAQ